MGFYLLCNFDVFYNYVVVWGVFYNCFGVMVWGVFICVLLLGFCGKVFVWVGEGILSIR